MQKKPKAKSGYFDPSPDSAKAKPCDHPGCAHPGLHKAPKNRHRLNEYFWFCLDHVRDYNQQWNYYQGLDETEVEWMRRHETVWERPSWPFGPKAQYKKFRESFARQWHDFRDRFGIFDDMGDDQAQFYRHNRSQANDMDNQAVRALNTLGLTPPLNFARVKSHYRDLVKQFHPDLHGGNKDAEERFKSINEAFQTIKKIMGETV